MRDLFSFIKASLAEPPVAAVTNDTAFVSTILDTQNWDSAVFLGVFGSVADSDATFTVLVEDGDDSALSDAAAVSDANLLGVEAMGLDFADDNSVFKIGYKGTKRYVRVTVTPANNTGNIFFAGIWLQGHPRTSPNTTQVVA